MEKRKRGRQPKVTDNKAVARWLIEHKWKNLDREIRARMPAFVDDAVYSALYVCGESSNGTLNVSVANVYRCMMLPELSTTNVRILLEGFGERYADRTIRLITQVTRFAVRGIETRIEQYETVHQPSEEDLMSWKLEQQFVRDYHTKRPSPLHSQPVPPAPGCITRLYHQGKYLEYGEAMRAFRQGYLRQDKY